MSKHFDSKDSEQEFSVVIERWLQIGLIVLSVLGLAMLGELDQSRQMQFFFVVAAIASIFIVDIWKWAAAPSWAANLLALIAMVACARKFYSGGGQAYQLSAVADLLLYMQLILFFQQKAQRVYWVLFVLALLRVIVAATMEPEAQFGPLLVAFVGMTIATLTCFYLWREEDRTKVNNSALQTIKADSHSVSTAPLSVMELAKRRVSGPISAAAIGVSALDMRKMFWGIARDTLRISFISLVLAAIFFALMPRLGENGWAMARFGQAISGFSPDVQLHSIASLQQSPDPVFRVKLENAFTNEPLRFDDPLYIQGNVLRHYGRSGRGVSYAWTKNDPGIAPWAEMTDLPVTSDQQSLVRQHFTMDIPTRTGGTLFAIHPLFRTASTPAGIRLLDKGNHLQGSGPVGFEYTLLTNAFIDGRQSAIRPIDNREEPRYVDLISIDDSRFPGLIAKCDSILQQAPGALASRYASADALTKHLKDSGEYAYSLDRSSLRIPAGTDPVEDFVTTSKKGYCQFFASALALMLRHRNIPCRLVNGFCTGEYNEVGGYFQVRQLHAHVWVEAYFTSDELAPMGDLAKRRYPRGAWVRFDPTPEADLPAFQGSRSNVAGDSMNFAQILWRDYVVGLNPQRQQKMVYDPFKSTMLDSVARVFSVSAWKEWLSRFRQLDGVRDLLSGDWFNWRGGLAAMTICAGLYLVYQFCVWASVVLRELLRKSKSKRGLTRSRSNVEFYDRFEAILRRVGLVRAAGQTPREFVAEMAPRLETSASADLNARSQGFVGLYYQVRFGDQALDPAHRAEVESLLDALSRLPKGAPLKNGAAFRHET